MDSQKLAKSGGSIFVLARLPFLNSPPSICPNSIHQLNTDDYYDISSCQNQLVSFQEVAPVLSTPHRFI